MTTLKSRLAKLESAMTPPLVFHVARFILAPDNLNPMGYACGDITIVRGQGESEEALHKRCIDSVTWPDFSHRHIFEPLEGVCH
jgi:hypothetical protein